MGKITTESDNSEVLFDDEFPRDGSMIKQIKKDLRKDIEDDFRYNTNPVA